MRRLHVLLGGLLLLLSACTTIDSQLGVPGGRTLRATVTTADGARIDLWRWSPTRVDARKVLVLPELGFDHRLVTRLCERLRDQGFDVVALDGREVTGQRGGHQGLAGWRIDVARAVAAHGPKPYVVAIGLAGDAAWLVAELNAVAGIVAINVPVRHGFDNEAIRAAMATMGYDPRAWLHADDGALLIGAGHTTPERDRSALLRLARSTSSALRTDVAAFMRGPSMIQIPRVPLMVFVSVKDNLVPSEDVLPPELGSVAALRLGRMEFFSRDYGHLDWLVDDEAIEEIVPVIARDLEQMP